jgi:hypothetical protein
MTMNTTSKLVWTVVAVAGLIAVAGLLSEKGIRIAGGGRQEKSQPRRAEAGQAAHKGRHHKAVIGTAPIPLLVNGKPAATLVGNELEALNEVTIISSHDLRTGWTVADILNAHGVQHAKEVVFTDKDGKHWTATWEQVSDPRQRLVVTYNRNGDHLLLFSGPEVASGTRPSPKEARETLKSYTGLVVFPGVVKIEVSG